MRATVLAAVAALCVMAALVSPAAAEEEQNREAGPAFEAEISVAFSEGSFSAEAALALTEELRTTANLDDFRLSLDVTKDTVKGSIRARFGFDNLSELAEWQESDSVQGLLRSLEQIGGVPVRVDVSGQLGTK